ncbi:hypothetical protein GCM10010533_24720 [Mycolicibacterium pallens]
MVMNTVRYATAAPELTGRAVAVDHTEDSKPSERDIGSPILLGPHRVAQESLRTFVIRALGYK